MEFLNPEMLLALVTLSAMEIVLGIDNIIVLAITVARVEPARQDFVRRLGLFLALFFRLGLLFSLSWIMRLTEPLFTVLAHSFSGRDLILLFGGLFLLMKSTLEIHAKVESKDGHHGNTGKAVAISMTSALVQVIIMDLVFSLDSVITAVGMVQSISIMVAAMVISMVVMQLSAKSISEFVEKHPAVKLLALSFLLLIGVLLVAESMGAHVNKGYIYFAMFFSLAIELLNMRYRSKNQLVMILKGEVDRLKAGEGE